MDAALHNGCPSEQPSAVQQSAACIPTAGQACSPQSMVQGGGVLHDEVAAGRGAVRDLPEGDRQAPAAPQGPPGHAQRARARPGHPQAAAPLTRSSTHASEGVSKGMPDVRPQCMRRRKLHAACECAR